MGNIVRFLTVLSAMIMISGCDAFGVNATVDAEEQDEGEATAPSQVDNDDDGYPPAEDCNDSNPNVNTGTAESCGNGVDDDCDLEIDEDCTPATPTPEDDDDDDVDEDDDDDGYFDCSNDDDCDCDDHDEDVNPGADESCNGDDDDCDSDVDEGADCEEDDWEDYIKVGYDVDEVCFSGNGFQVQYRSASAYMVGNGGDLNFTFQAKYQAEPDDGYYCFDTTNWTRTCYEATIVSSLKSDGKTAATSSSDTGDWWDNYEFCTSESETADQWCAHQTGTDWLVGFCTTSSGVIPNGDDS